METSVALVQSHPPEAFILYQKYGTIGDLPMEVYHPVKIFLVQYMNKGIPIHTRPSCTQWKLYTAIT